MILVIPGGKLQKINNFDIENVIWLNKSWDQLNLSNIL